MKDIKKQIKDLTDIDLNTFVSIIESLTVMIGLFMLTITGGIYTIVFLDSLGWTQSFISGVGLIFTVGVILPASVFVGYMAKKWISPFSGIKSRVKELYDISRKKHISIHTIEEVLLLSTKIQNHIQKLNSSIHYSYLLSGKSKQKLLKLKKLALEISFLSLSKMRDDLIYRTQEQTNILESAKSEVEKNISGSAEFEAISELQKSRLDLQIEKFEELQKKLVRI